MSIPTKPNRPCLLDFRRFKPSPIVMLVRESNQVRNKLVMKRENIGNFYFVPLFPSHSFDLRSFGEKTNFKLYPYTYMHIYAESYLCSYINDQFLKSRFLFSFIFVLNYLNQAGIFDCKFAFFQSHCLGEKAFERPIFRNDISCWSQRITFPTKCICERFYRRMKFTWLRRLIH